MPIVRIVHQTDARGVIAVCSRGHLGLITNPRKRLIQYEDGDGGLAYIGVNVETSEPWSSRYPTMLGTIWDWLRSKESLALWILAHWGDTRLSPPKATPTTEWKLRAIALREAVI